ncbi:MAG: hypothetical protein ABEI52_08720, partial [Halobacteriaceae archaeon]
MLTEWEAGGPVQPDLFRTDYSNDSATNLSFTAIGSQRSVNEQHNRLMTGKDAYEAGEKVYNFSWNQPHKNIRLKTRLNTSNVTQAAKLSSIGMNASQYMPSTTTQWGDGFASGVSADDGLYGGADG